MQGGGTPCHGRRVREQDGNRWYIAATWLATSNDYTILLTKLNERLRENGLIWVIYFYHFLIHFDLTFRFFLPPFLKNSRRRPPMSFNPKRCNRTPFFHPLGCRFTQVPGTPFFATLADHFRLSRVEISWTNFLPSSLSCETSKPFKFHKSLVLYCSFFSSGLLDQKTTKQAETTSRLRHQAEFLFKSKQKVNWYDMSSLSLIHWWSCCFLCDTETIPVVSWIFLAAPGGFESPEVTVGTIRHGGRSRRGEARRSSKIGPLGLAEKMCYNRPGGKIHRDHEIGELITMFFWEKKLMQMLLHGKCWYINLRDFFPWKNSKIGSLQKKNWFFRSVYI